MAEPGSALAGLPRDARAVILILESMGVREFEPRVVTQLMEFCQRYIADVLGDARAFSEHAGKGSVDTDDVKLAIQSRANLSFTQPPPRELLLEIARVRNAAPIPPIETVAGIPLPPEEDCLVQPNFQWASPSVRAALPRAGAKGGPAAAAPKQGSKKRGADTVEVPEDGMEWEDEAAGGTKAQGTPGAAAALEPTSLPDEQRSAISFSVARRR